MLQVAWVCEFVELGDGPGAASPGAAFFVLGRGLLPWSAVAGWAKVYLYRATQLKHGRRAASGAVNQTAYCKTIQRRRREVTGVSVMSSDTRNGWMERDRKLAGSHGIFIYGILNMHFAYLFIFIYFVPGLGQCFVF